MLHVVDAGLLRYRLAWDLQLQYHERVLSGEFPHGVLILLEHPPVITIGRRADAQSHLLASPKLLQARGVELVETDRGGDITFHGPGQLVAYPILPLNHYQLNLHSYLRLLEQVVIDALAHFGISAHRDPPPTAATGVWVTSAERWPQTPDHSAKIAAIGIKVRRWITLHGLALNIFTDLSCFDLINPCGLSRPVTSLKKMLPDTCPDISVAKENLAKNFERLISASFGMKTVIS